MTFKHRQQIQSVEHLESWWISNPSKSCIVSPCQQATPPKGPGSTGLTALACNIILCSEQVTFTQDLQWILGPATHTSSQKARSMSNILALRALQQTLSSTHHSCNWSAISRNIHTYQNIATKCIQNALGLYSDIELCLKQQHSKVKTNNTNKTEKQAWDFIDCCMVPLGDCCACVRSNPNTEPWYGNIKCQQEFWHQVNATWQCNQLFQCRQMWTNANKPHRRKPQRLHQLPARLLL